eukprot:362516-Chlamydomonas_euryale.AAC.4
MAESSFGGQVPACACAIAPHRDQKHSTPDRRMCLWLADIVNHGLGQKRRRGLREPSCLVGRLGCRVNPLAAWFYLPAVGSKGKRRTRTPVRTRRYPGGAAIRMRL